MISSWDEHAELEASRFQNKETCPLVLTGCCVQVPYHLPQHPVNSETKRCRGIWTFCPGGSRSANGLVALLLLALKTKCKLIPCSSWAMEAPCGCSPMQLNPLPTAEACGKQGWCWSCTGQLCLHWVCALFPLCLSAPGHLAQEAAPIAAQGLESGTFSDQLHSC